ERSRRRRVRRIADARLSRSDLLCDGTLGFAGLPREPREPTCIEDAHHAGRSGQHAEGVDLRETRRHAHTPRLFVPNARHMTIEARHHGGHGGHGGKDVQDSHSASSASSVVERFLPWLGLAIIAVSETATLLHIEPFWTWNTPIAWTGFIVFADAI